MYIIPLDIYLDIHILETLYQPVFTNYYMRLLDMLHYTENSEVCPLSP